jgi:Tol biopolymer transport system component
MRQNIFTMKALAIFIFLLFTLPTASAQQNKPMFFQEVSWSPDSRSLLFSGFKQGGSADIYVMRADGSRVKRLTNHPASDTWGSFSPDGRRIAFQSKRDGAQEDIYVMNADGSNVKRLTTDEGRDIAPSWSPDGKRIAFSSSRDGGLHVYVMNSDGKKQVRLTKLGSEPIKYYNPVWSPNGRKLVFYSDKGDRKDQIHVIDAGGSRQTMLTDGVGNNIFPAWSAGGGRVIFSSNRDGLEKAMYTMSSDGTDLRRFPRQRLPKQILPTGFVVRWSPNRKKVAFVSGAYPVSHIFTMNPDGSRVIQLTKDSTE